MECLRKACLFLPRVKLMLAQFWKRDNRGRIGGNWAYLNLCNSLSIRPNVLVKVWKESVSICISCPVDAGSVQQGRQEKAETEPLSSPVILETLDSLCVQVKRFHFDLVLRWCRFNSVCGGAEMRINPPSFSVTLINLSCAIVWIWVSKWSVHFYLVLKWSRFSSAGTVKGLFICSYWSE